MPTTVPTDPVLLLGGTGVVGRAALSRLRVRYPELPLTIGTRSLAKGRAAASWQPAIDAVEVDLARRDLGLAADARFSAVVMLVKDDTLNALRYAQARGAAYLDISTAAFEIGPEISLHVQNPEATALLLTSNWLAGTSTWVALHFAGQFDRIAAVRIAALLDEHDVGGMTHRSQLFANLDVLSLSAQLDAASVSFEFALGETSSRRGGAPFSTEIIIEIEGARKDGRHGRYRFEAVHPDGQAPLTATGISLGLGGLLGLDGQPPAPPGLHLPHRLVDPHHAVRVMGDAGASIREA